MFQIGIDITAYDTKYLNIVILLREYSTILCVQNIIMIFKILLSFLYFFHYEFVNFFMFYYAVFIHFYFGSQSDKIKKFYLLFLLYLFPNFFYMCKIISVFLNQR